MKIERRCICISAHYAVRRRHPLRRRYLLRRCCLSHWRPNKNKEKNLLTSGRHSRPQHSVATLGRQSWSPILIANLGRHSRLPLSAATLGCRIFNKKNLSAYFSFSKKKRKSKLLCVNGSAAVLCMHIIAVNHLQQTNEPQIEAKANLTRSSSPLRHLTTTKDTQPLSSSC